MIGCLHGCGRSITAWIWESPAALAAKLGVDTLVTPLGPRQLTVALKNGTGFLLPKTGMTSPVTVTSTMPCWLTVPEAAVIAQGRPPPVIPRSFTAPTADPVTGVIVLKSVRLPPSSASAGRADNASKPRAPVVATTVLINLPMATPPLAEPFAEPFGLTQVQSIASLWTAALGSRRG